MYNPRGTGPTSTGLPKIILDISIVLPLEFDSQHEAGSMGVPVYSISQTSQGSVSSSGDILSHILTCSTVHSETQWSRAPDYGF